MFFVWYCFTTLDRQKWKNFKIFSKKLQITQKDKNCPKIWKICYLCQSSPTFIDVFVRSIKNSLILYCNLRQNCQNLLKKAQNYPQNMKNLRKILLKLPYFHGWFKKNRTITGRYYTVILGENLNLTQKISNLPTKYENFKISVKAPLLSWMFFWEIFF